MTFTGRIARLALALVLTAPTLAQAQVGLLAPKGAALTYSGPTSGTIPLYNGTTVTFTTVGTYTLTVTAPWTFTATGVAGGGGGAANVAGNNAGGGGGGGASTTGTQITLLPGRTYTLIVGAAGPGGALASDGVAGGTTSFVNTTDTTNLVVLPGGCAGNHFSNACTSTTPTVGSNLFTGGSGGRGAVDGGSLCTAGVTQTSGAAGGGGGGDPVSNGCAGGNGASETGGAPNTGAAGQGGGKGGGYLFGAVNAGGGGAAAGDGDGVGHTGATGEQGAFALVAGPR